MAVLQDALVAGDAARHRVRVRRVSALQLPRHFISRSHVKPQEGKRTRARTRSKNKNPLLLTGNLDEDVSCTTAELSLNRPGMFNNAGHVNRRSQSTLGFVVPACLKARTGLRVYTGIYGNHKEQRKGPFFFIKAGIWDKLLKAERKHKGNAYFI